MSVRKCYNAGLLANIAIYKKECTAYIMLSELEGHVILYTKKRTIA